MAQSSVKSNGVNRKIAVLRSTFPRLTKPALKAAFLRAWLCCHIVFVTGWLLPPQSAVGASLRGLGRPYLLLTGTSQWWDLFAPNPLARDVEICAQITYKDGTTRDWWYPRVSKLGYIQGYRQDRWRKLIENVSSDDASLYWPALASYAARVNPGPGPVRVRLVRATRLVPGFGQPERAWTMQTIWEGYE